MDGKLIIAAGLVLIVGGGIGLYHAYEGARFGGAALAWASIIGGALVLLGGIARFMSRFMSPQRAEESGYGETEIRLLVEAMGTMAAADGEIAGQEIETVAQIYERMLGTRIAHDDVRRILDGLGKDFDIAPRIAAERGRLSPQMRRLIFNCCYLVMMSDLVEERHESEAIRRIGHALGYDDEQMQDMIALAGV
ncbi:MAG: TerB family tellurite resistance protein [Pseudomonadota bacterium]|nr:TerB family tellurite resistance protein [Pseudomonadota bacterium]